MNLRYRVELSQTERTELTALLSAGKHAARRLKRAQILLAADAGASDDDIAISRYGSSCRRTCANHLIQTGVGGRYGGADMTPEHAAGLLTALMIVRTPATSMRSVARLTRSYLKDLKSLSGRWSRVLALPQLRGLKPAHTFGDAFTALLASIADGDLERAIKKWALDKPHGTRSFFELGEDRQSQTFSTSEYRIPYA
jgi:hypothetical protein